MPGRKKELEERLSAVLNYDFKGRLNSGEGSPAAIKEDLLRKASKIICVEFPYVDVKNVGGEGEYDLIELLLVSQFTFERIIISPVFKKFDLIDDGGVVSFIFLPKVKRVQIYC